ncbi:hypothetical protein [Burkholderia gladioli]|uniref:Uncharacterized protein n=1 Tax=Burkholderia gladioli (strain BSR3) TaxID=999541 RepID=F2LSI3_BURGS|nr:hypothetical protein [Burkholderia gladioli]AEA65779.1 hypothetical protein bgla_3p0780 [Burkholderia gladioli BSR3]
MGDGSDLCGTGDDDQSAEGLGWGDNFELPDAWADLDPETGGNLDAVPVENVLSSPRYALEEFNVASQGDIQVSRIRRRGMTPAADAGSYITEEDFDDDIQRDAFLLLNGYKRTLFETGYSAKEKNAAIKFFFGRNPSILRASDAIKAIHSDIRVDVVLLRLVYEMYLREFRLNHAFPFDEIDCPDRVIGNAGYIFGEGGVWAVETIWRQPGISLNELYTHALISFPCWKPRPVGVTQAEWIGQELKQVIDRLIHDYVIASRVSAHDGVLGEFLYVTGRNPAEEVEERARETFQRTRAGNFSWSRLF